MSASREKKNRQDQAGMNMSDPKTAREAQQRKAEKRSNMLYGLIAAAFVLLAVVAIGWRVSVWYSERAQQTTIAATVNGEEYTAAEVNFYFWNTVQTFYQQNYYIISYLGLDLSGDLREQTYAEGETWFDFFLEQALEQMADVQALNAAAEADGYTWNDELQTQLDTSLDSLNTTAATYGYTSEQYLRSVFGDNMTQAVYEAQMKRAMIAEGYSTQYQESLTYTDAQVEAAYAEDPKSFDKVSYEAVRINGNADTTDADGNTIDVTDEMAAEALSGARDAADAMYAAWQDGGDLSALAADNDKATYSSAKGGSWSDSVLMNWLFDDARQNGDSAVLEDADNAYCYVVSFRERFRDDYTVDARHILIQVDETDLDTESATYEADLEARKAEAKAQAEELLAQWQAGDATEDSFAQLANENSSDSGSNTNGGLYEQIVVGSMVEEFNDWCFDASRKPGDTGIVYGDNGSYKGYHIMYFVGTDTADWKTQAQNQLLSSDYSAWYEEKTAGYTAEQVEAGIQYVG